VSSPANIVWSEGLFLRQPLALGLLSHPWGVRALAVDAGSLRENVLRIDALSLVFPGGEILCAPSPDALPLPLPLADIPSTASQVVVHAALPRLEHAGGNGSRTAARDACDDRAQQNARANATGTSISSLRPQVRLLTDIARPLAGRNDTVPLVRLRRRSNGRFEPDPAYIPPSVSVGGAAGLYLRLTRLMEKLLATVNVLYAHHRAPMRGAGELRVSDVSSFWHLHTASAGYAALLHLLHHKDLHPERLYESMLGVAGSLIVYSRSPRLEELPMYRHDDAGPSFARLDAIIRELLDTVVHPRCRPIACTIEKPDKHAGAPSCGSGMLDLTV
jgi:type VI secretion system protein ImpJ